MNKAEAHDLLNKVKNGHNAPQHLVNTALTVCGDLGMACSPCTATRVEGSGMAQGEGVGGLPDTAMGWNNDRFDRPYESPI
jgi:hypothetical protein